MTEGDRASAPMGTLGNNPELYRLLVESVHDYAIFALDPDGRIITWNAGAQRFKGYKAAEIIGQHFSVFYPPERVAEGHPEHELRVAAAEGRFEEEGWRVRKDGTRFWANVVITALRDRSGALVGFAKVTRDLTERREAAERALASAAHLAAEEAARTAAEAQADALRRLAGQLETQAVELETRSRQAEEANRAKSDFLAAMSHELRTPLNAIGGYAELLALGVRGELSESQRDDVERIRRSQQHLLGIINDLLNFTRVEAGRLSYDVRPVAARRLLDDVAPMIAPQAAARGIRFERTAVGADVVARADAAKAEQILLNLLSNAVKFTPSGGLVTLDCVADARSVALRVRDTGMGIAADQLESIFEPFVQVGRSFARPAEGTGLGLAISRDLARGMGGELRVESAPGVGSTFSLVLPRA